MGRTMEKSGLSKLNKKESDTLDKYWEKAETKEK